MTRRASSACLLHIRLLFVILLTGADFCQPVAAGAPEEGSELTLDPAEVLGHDACVKCHAAEIEVWRQTPHCTTFVQLHRKKEAREIAQRLGLPSIKHSDVCTRCHYTQQQVEGELRVVSGVSCESCHGAARPWLDVHHDYGGPDATREQETAEHAQWRRQTSIQRGMRNPVNLYLVARSCLNCHTAPHERLVNEGGHPPGSLDFELVAWSQGMVRHNFVRSDGKVNNPSPPDRLRVMYVVGLMADLEYSLRATALATQKATYGITAARRANTMRQRLHELQQQLDDPYVQQALDAVSAVTLKLNNAPALTAAADAVGKAAYAFAEAADGSQLQAVDRWLPPPSSWK